jgi:phosphatidylglycerophosphatase C
MLATLDVRPRAVDARTLLRELESLRESDQDGLAFDADGTLWAGDVGEDVFLAAVERELLREDAWPALAKIAARHGIRTSVRVADIARAIRGEHRRGRFPEREMFEVMTICYAGWTLEELVDHAHDVLQRAQLARRLNPELAPILDWARRRRLRTVVISGSPSPIVQVAARLWDFLPEDVVAGTAALHNGRFAGRLLRPIPYAEVKREIGCELIGERRWLASFGDSAFDLHMLLAARVGVAVRPTWALRASLSTLPSIVLLS